MQTILLFPTSLLMLVTALFVGACLAVALLLFRWAPRLLGTGDRSVPVPAFMGVVATAWALSLGFAASDLWSLGNRADQVVAAERSSIMRLLGAAAPSALDLPALHDSVSRYVRLVLDREVEDQRGTTFGDPLVDAAVQDIRMTVLTTVRSPIPAVVGSKIINDFDELQDARNARLGINVSLIDPSKWYLLLSFTFMTMVTIVLLHVDRPEAGKIACAIFSVTALAGLWILVVHVDPFSNVPGDYLSHGLAIS